MLLTRGTGEVGSNGVTSLQDTKLPMCRGSVGHDLESLEKDRAIHTDPDETRRRRTIKLDKKNNTWGFTLQTYGIRNKKTQDVDVMTYVDYVELHGPAGLADLRRGDVILSVNGENVEGAAHRILVDKIKQSTETLRLVVLFEDCCKKVELYERFIKLKLILKMKLEEYRHLERKENYILEGLCSGRFSRLSSVRSSLKSSSSSDWDRYSMVVSPTAMLTNVVPSQVMAPHFLFPKRCASSVDDTSELSLDGTFNDSFSDDSDAFLAVSGSCSDIVSLQGYRKNKVDSLSNKSVSSLITETQRKELERSDSSDTGTSLSGSIPFMDTPTNSGTPETDVSSWKDLPKGDNLGEVTSEQRSDLVGSSSDIKDMKENISEKKETTSEKEKGDNSDIDHPTDESALLPKIVNDRNDVVREIDDQSAREVTKEYDKHDEIDNDSGKVNSMKDMVAIGGTENSMKETDHKIDNSATEIQPYSPKRFVKGILVNDDDHLTKL